MAAVDSACTWLCTYQRRDGAASSLDLAFITVTGSAIAFSNSGIDAMIGCEKEGKTSVPPVLRSNPGFP